VSPGSRPGRRRGRNHGERAIETDAEIWTVHGRESGTGAMIDIASQSATGIGIDGGIENVRLVQVDEIASESTVIANVVAFSCIEPCFCLIITVKTCLALLSFPMSTRYIVFLGAPSPSSTLNDDEISYQWRTIASTTLDPASQETSTDSDLFAGFPSSALDAATRRISALTESVMFADEDEDGGDTQIVEEHLIGGEIKLSS
jgi:hypothetical protein